MFIDDVIKEPLNAIRHLNIDVRTFKKTQI